MIELTNLEAAERSSVRARRRTVPCVLVAVALTLGLALRANGQGSVGAVRGVARSEADGTPIPFVLVRLLLSDSKDGARRQGITNAQGRFQFDSVPSGTYRLQLLRIGFRPALSSPIDVRVGETTEQEVRASMIGIPLPTVMVYAENACLTGDRVAKDPYLSALWEHSCDRGRKHVFLAADTGTRYVESAFARHAEARPMASMRVDLERSHRRPLGAVVGHVVGPPARRHWSDARSFTP